MVQQSSPLDVDAQCGYIAIVKRRKPKSLRKEDTIRLRVTAQQKDMLIRAANTQGLEVSTWLRTLGLNEAKRALGPLAESETP